MVRPSVHSVSDSADAGSGPDFGPVRRKIVPRFVWTAAAVTVLCVAIVVVGFWYARKAAVEQCERSVAARADNRAMWEYLVAENTEPDSPRVVAFVEELDKRLPPLECDGARHVPVEKGQ
jgi:heme exporter protein D